MNEQDLFRAIGHAGDEFLLEIEQPTVRRLPRKPALIAAALAIALLTACAAPAVIRSFDKLTGGKPAENGNGFQVITYSSGSRKPESIEFFPTDVEVEVTSDPNAPDTIEEYWLPLTLLEYCDVESYTADTSEFSLKLSMNIPRFGKAYGFLYQQSTLPKEGSIVIPDILNNGTDWEQTFQTYGETNALEFYGKSFLEDSDGSTLLYDGNRVASAYIRNIFWSDGFYLYCLKIPRVYPIASITDVEEIITSLTMVEDITEYLPAQ